MTTQQYIQHQTEIMNAAQNKHAPLVYSALQSGFRDAAAIIRSRGVEAARSTIPVLPIGEPIERAIRRLYHDVARVNANFIYSIVSDRIDRILKSYDPAPSILKRTSFGKNERWEALVNEFFNQFLLDKVVRPISDTSKRLILEMITKGVDEGLGAEEIARMILASDVNKTRAILIVRTETTRATNFAGMAAAYETGYQTQKNWIEIKDDRTRRTHRHGTGVGGEIRDLDQPYGNGLMFPGDPNGGANEVCNCRCCQSFVPKRDANGRLIPIVRVAGAGQMAAQAAITGGSAPSIVDVLNLAVAVGQITNLADQFLNTETE